MRVTYLEANISEPNASFDFGGNRQVEAAFSNTLPESVFSAKSQVVSSLLLVQVLLAVDISRSRYSLSEVLKSLPPDINSLSELESFQAATGGTRQSRQHHIIRLRELGGGSDDGNLGETQEGGGAVGNGETADIGLLPSGTSVHKLILQDSKGSIFYGIEIQRIQSISMLLPIGTKLLLENTRFQNGIALLQPQNVKFLGGKLDQLDRNSRKNLEAYVANNL